MLLPFFENNFPGKLIVVEGISRSGKSTFIRENLSKYFKNSINVSWNSYPCTKSIISHLKQSNALSSWVYSLSHLLDYSMTYYNIILPALNEGKIVISDRYFYTSWVRDRIRGIDDKYLYDLFKNFLRPNVIYYLEVDAEESLKRLKQSDKKLYKYNAGQEIFPELDLETSYIKYTKLQIEGYRKLIVDNSFTIDKDFNNLDRLF